MSVHKKVMILEKPRKGMVKKKLYLKETVYSVMNILLIAFVSRRQGVTLKSTTIFEKEV